MLSHRSPAFDPARVHQLAAQTFEIEARALAGLEIGRAHV
jgi:hypothetical protein